MVSIVAFQAVDPGSIPGPRNFLFASCPTETIFALFSASPKPNNSERATRSESQTRCLPEEKKSTSGEVRTHALKRGPELESGALTTRPQMPTLYLRSKHTTCPSTGVKEEKGGLNHEAPGQTRPG